MKKQESSNGLFKEVLKIITRFFKRCGLHDDLLGIPPNVKRLSLRVNGLDYGMSLINLAFSFMLKISNSLIESHFILLGIIFYMLYKGQNVVGEAYATFKRSESDKFNLLVENEISVKGSKIISMASEKILKFDTKNQLYKIMSNEAVLNTIKKYYNSLWMRKLTFPFTLAKIANIVIVLFIAVLTNETISNVIFVPMLIGFTIISFVSSAYISFYRDTFFERDRNQRNKQSVLINDLLRCPNIVNKDTSMRIAKYQESIKDSNLNILEFSRKRNLSRVIVTSIETLCHYGIIIAYLLNVEWNSISLSTIANITATLAIVESAMSQISNIEIILSRNNDEVLALEKEEPDMKLILDVYNKETERIRNSESKEVKRIHLEPFSIKYVEESANDKPFTLSSTQTIDMAVGDVVTLYGPSGSGKSTFMKVLTERIKVEKTTETPSTSRYMFYDEKLRFGSLSIYEELFCCEENPDLTKMQTILENLHLWQELSANCIDIWLWMKQKKFDQTLSNGQKQRLILGKMLYWLDEEIDVLVLDECTSGLDTQADSNSADAERTLEYIVQYANKDKKRIIIISTHQNIDGFKEKLKAEFNFKNLMFSKDGDKNLVLPM